MRSKSDPHSGRGDRNRRKDGQGVGVQKRQEPETAVGFGDGEDGSGLSEMWNQRANRRRDICFGLF